MGHSPGNDLSRHFPFAGILSVAGIEVKGPAPDIGTCPICHDHTLSVYLIEGSAWLRCFNYKCLHQGDTLETYKLIRKIEDMHEAVHTAISEGLTNTPPSHFTDYAIESYQREYVDRRKRDAETWRLMQAGVSITPPPAFVARLQEEHLWGGWNSHGHKLLSQVLGGGTASEMNAALNTGREVLPRKGFTSVMAIGYHSVPGRVCMIHFRGPEQERWYNLPNTVEEGGLAMLDSFHAREGTVFAFGDEMLALHLHRKYFLDNATPLKLVVYNPWTRAAWQQVIAEKVVLWDKKIDYRIFAHARRVGNSHVCLRTYEENVYHYVTRHSVYDIMHTVEEAAKPWKEAFVEWLFNDKVQPSLKSEAVRTLNLDTREREDIERLCSRPQKEKLSHYFEDIQITQQIVVNRNTVTDKDTGWWLALPKDREERISDARIRIEREVNDPVAGTTFLYGHIIFKGKKLQFCQDKNEIAKAPKSWVEKIIAKAGMGLPIIADAWGKHLLTLAKNFSTPSTSLCYASYGVQPGTGELVMPKFKFTKQGMVEEDFYIPSNKIPGLLVRRPQPRKLYPTDRGFAARYAYLACFATLGANWVRISRGEAPIPVVAIGSPGSAAHGALKSFARNIDMTTLTLSDGRKKPVEDMRGLLGKFGFPSRIETRSTGLLGFYPTRNNDFVYLSADKLEGAVLKASSGWWIIDAPAVNVEPDIMPPIDDFFNWMADMQRRDYEPVGEPHQLNAVVEDLCNWYRRTIGLRGAGHAEAIMEILKVDYSKADSFIDLLYRLQTSGHLRVEHAEMQSALKATLTPALIIDDAREQVYMSRLRLDRLLRTLHLPPLELVDIQEELHRIGGHTEDIRLSDGAAIPLEYWNKRAAHWKAVNL